jgi:hypothetical protein
MKNDATLLWSIMCKHFLKLNIENEEGNFLALKHPNAFILLYFIARRARRVIGHPDGLEIGECHLGDWNSLGMTRQNYRTALRILCVKKYIQIQETNRTRKKSTTGLTTTGTKVKLLNSRIWDINAELNNHRPNHCLTTAQPLPNHEQEYKEDISNDISKYARSAKRPRQKDNLKFNFDSWAFEGIEEKDMQAWKEIYPLLDLNVEIKRSIEWLKSNRSKANKSQWRKFLNNWFSTANGNAERKNMFKTLSSKTSDRRTKNMDGTPITSIAEGLF